MGHFGGGTISECGFELRTEILEIAAGETRHIRVAAVVQLAGRTLPSNLAIMKKGYAGCQFFRTCNTIGDGEDGRT